jgi:ribosomal-protein-alanine N-acetyltransferase
VLPRVTPRLVNGSVVLRAFEGRDADLVMSVAQDSLIPLITTVPTSGTREDAFAYIARQHSRLETGVGGVQWLRSTRFTPGRS